ncbi:alpha/beta-hydrolase [Amniculicola lignicola CBS 123094]|uniref:Alpha/beta-hydrolase n=1 Tax=Amniculicola lignicola CBS 123094 TaxID=1392246 RepID=A0A6A5WHW9_9PLEO|nr:alpha/beta-hydrolase [Amniculicola lignicola CBS 123094]
MSEPGFEIFEHTLPGQHIRGYPHGATSDDAVLHVAIKEYRNRHMEREEDAVTIIAAHGVGFPKECYEALWDDILKAAKGFKIRSIWIADIANHGASYALNEASLGDDPNANDHARDLLLMVNVFRDRMKPPFVGIGHSLGAFQIASLSLLHPRLFHTLILIEPVIQLVPPPGPNAAFMASLRRDAWESRTKAETALSRNPFFKTWDPRVLQTYLKMSLRDRADGTVTLATPKAQEAWSYVRSTFHSLPEDTTTVAAKNRERLVSPDLVPFSDSSTMVFTRSEFVPMIEHLPSIRPRTLFIYGNKSHINGLESRELHLSRTGKGPGGSGGRADGNVEEKVVKGSHLCCFEGVASVAADISSWLEKEMLRWKAERDFWATVDSGKSKNGGKDLSDKWIEGVKQNSRVQRPEEKPSSKL